jgi:uncharacterized membrane protein YkvI
MCVNITIGWTMFARLTESKWGRVLLPAIVFQSVSIGGGFSTGREVVEYSAKFGSLGLISILTYFLTLTVSGVLIYEFARQFELYDYKSLMKNLIWKFWPVFELVYVILAIVVIAVVASAGGNLMNQILGIPVFAANVVLIGFISGVLYFGRSAIERFSVIGTTFVYLVYLTMFGFVLFQHGGHAVDVVLSGSVSYAENATIGAAVESALLYAGYSLIGFIPPLFLIRRLETRTEAIAAGVLSSVLLTIPLLLSYLSLMSYYPNGEVMSAPVPWLAMLEAGGPLLVMLYGVAIGWTLTETGVGLVHSITDRVDEDVRESTFRFLADRDGLTAVERGVLGFGIFTSAILLSRVGIISLISQAYTLLAILFIAVLGIPLVTVGLARMRDPSWRREMWPLSQ